jgi:type IV pilus assembly protein PilF
MRLERISIGLILVVATLALTACGQKFQRGSTTKLNNQPPALSAKEDPNGAAEINLGLGRGYLERGQLQVALEKLNKALELNPKLAPAHTLVAVVYEKIGETQQAETHYKRAVELAPKSGAMNNNYGTFLCHQRRYDEAEVRFVQALADPFYETPEIALANRGSCALSAGKDDIAEQSFRAALKRRPDQAEALFHLSSILYRQGDFLRARAFLQRYELVSSPSAESLELSMQIELKLGNEQTAREYRERLMSTFPDSDQAQRLGQAENTP